MKTEKVLALLFLIGIAFKLFHWDGGSIITVITVLTLSALYLVGGFYFFCDGNLRRQNLAFSIIAGMSLCVVPLGILFPIQYWEGAQPMIVSATMVSVLFLIITIILRAFASDELKTYYNNMLWRTGILAGLSLLLLLTPVATFFEPRY